MSNAICGEKAIERLIPRCKDQDFSFISFVDGDGLPIEYMNNRTLVKLKCNKCGFIFNRMYTNIVSKNYKCPNCLHDIVSDKLRKPLDEAIRNINMECTKRHYSFNGFCDENGNDIEYNGVERAFLKLHCNICGNDWKSTIYKNFINGKGCPKCADNKRLTESEAIALFDGISKEREITFKGFCDRNGSPSKFISLSNTFLLLRCDKCGYEWSSTICSSFKNTKCGCPRCHTSFLEDEIYKLLSENYRGLFEYNKHYDWLDGLQLDFYIPSINVAIECQGKQHFVEDSGWRKTKEGKSSEFTSLLERDSRKRALCEKNGIKLLYFSNLKIQYPYYVFEDKNKLLEEIKRNGHKERL